MAISYAQGASGDRAAAGHHAQEALRFARTVQDPVLESDAQIAVADFHFESGDLTRARELYENALETRARLGLPARQGLVAIALAEVALAEAQPAVARDWLRKAAALAIDTRSKYIGQHVLDLCAALAAAGAEWSLSLRWSGASAQLRQTTGLSGHTMSHPKDDPRELAASALGFAAASEAERSGALLSYEQALSEVRAWLG